ncbi:hypothetical protein BDV33DRAFT_128156 [Aspergillus novoparasiticus]|uniref:Uncharacterized protein n=1 Tax=Aspergillus novoparasiticus TaxID=986946 RepID=A0A5N6EME9_9EURO|nr:hypothetical protein BDV33DRAFT_128156 [Aspergillus novoparasiticus]
MHEFQYDDCAACYVLGLSYGFLVVWMSVARALCGVSGGLLSWVYISWETLDMGRPVHLSAGCVVLFRILIRTCS